MISHKALPTSYSLHQEYIKMALFGPPKVIVMCKLYKCWIESPSIYSYNTNIQDNQRLYQNYHIMYISVYKYQDKHWKNQICGAFYGVLGRDPKPQHDFFRRNKPQREIWVLHIHFLVGFRGVLWNTCFVVKILTRQNRKTRFVGLISHYEKLIYIRKLSYRHYLNMYYKNTELYMNC